MNWKYIVGEILLIFVGINLAIWFNDWNSSKTIQKDKEIALTKIKEEVENNLQQLLESREQNQKIPLFYMELDSLKNEDEELVLGPEAMKSFVGKYENFFTAIDSVPSEDGKYKYEGDTFINLDITDLSSIAWDISKSTGIFHEFGFDCLYRMQGMYNTQELVQTELRKATEALSNKSIDDLVRILSFMNQLEEQLEEQYRAMIENIDNCK
ncbi:hypothetical protein [Flagellimonas meridianipacifica]|uniref:Uncharacterized protein n=1 Tax=Flagellimonas meridianipacifica TaxID=1080225 RepID=A0A2T0MES6_9FLAO|nr:hypothetical protein [Allomuricauda pacifica]PRX56064.1 hypothetical protein CLV81_0052 [Allomuricauda pacifica]